MKLPIVAVLAYPLENKYSVRVFRCDGLHLPKVNEYSSYYLSQKLCRSLGKHFNILNGLITTKLLNSKINQH